MNYRVFARVIGRILCAEAVFMAPALLISWYHGESESALAFLITMVLMVSIGLPIFFRRPNRRGFYAREGLFSVGIAWLVMSIFGAMPFYLSGAIPNIIDALFESVSGFTTTSASILNDVEALPMGMLYWRSFTNLIGGMGVLVFVLAFSPLSKDGGSSMHIMRAESPGVSVRKLVPRLAHTAKLLYAIYLTLTTLQIVMLLFGGVPLFDAVTIAFGTAGTGGFAIKNSSLADYSAYVQWVTTAFMLLFGVNFNVYYMLLVRDVRRAAKNEELRVYGGIILFSIVVIVVSTLSIGLSVSDTIRNSAFQVAAMISTTGFATVNYDAWPQLARMIMFTLMFIGASAGSTGGGFKVVRVVILFKSAWRALYRALHPNEVRLLHMSGDIIEDETVNSVQSYFVIYFLIIMFSTLLISIDGFSFETNLSAVVSSINNIGTGLGGVGPTMNYAQFPFYSKLILCLNMLIGRLEIYPMLVLLIPSAWRK